MPFSRTALLSLLPIMLILTFSSQSVSANENQKVLQNADNVQHIPISAVNENPKLAVSATNRLIGLASDSLIDEPLSYAHMGDQIHACAELMCPGSLISEYEFYIERNNDVAIKDKVARMACIEYIEHEMTVEQRRENKWWVFFFFSNPPPPLSLYLCLPSGLK